MTSRYALTIQWSDEDGTYVVFLPEWRDRVYQPVTDGASYEEAAGKGRQVLDTLIEQAQTHCEPLPQSHTYVAAAS